MDFCVFVLGVKREEYMILNLFFNVICYGVFVVNSF